MWSWIVTAVTATGAIFKIVSKYRFARAQDAQQHLQDNTEGVWEVVQENGGIGMTEIEVVWKPRKQGNSNGNGHKE